MTLACSHPPARHCSNALAIFPATGDHAHTTVRARPILSSRAGADHQNEGTPAGCNQPGCATSKPREPHSMSLTQDTAASIDDAIQKALAERRELVANVRALADFLEQHPEIPVGSVQARGPYHYGKDRSKLTAEIIARRDAAGPDVQLASAYDGDARLSVSFGDTVKWSEDWPKNAVCTPRIAGNDVIWDLPDLDAALAEA